MYRTGEQQNEYNAMNLTKTHGELTRRIFALITPLTSSVLHSIFSLFFFCFFFCYACVPILRKAVVTELNGETWIQLQQPSSQCKRTCVKRLSNGFCFITELNLKALCCNIQRAQTGHVRFVNALRGIILLNVKLNELHGARCCTF